MNLKAEKYEDSLLIVNDDTFIEAAIKLAASYKRIYDRGWYGEGQNAGIEPEVEEDSLACKPYFDTFKLNFLQVVDTKDSSKTDWIPQQKLFNRVVSTIRNNHLRNRDDRGDNTKNFYTLNGYYTRLTQNECFGVNYTWYQFNDDLKVFLLNESKDVYSMESYEKKVDELSKIDITLSVESSESKPDELSKRDIGENSAEETSTLIATNINNKVEINLKKDTLDYIPLSKDEKNNKSQLEQIIRNLKKLTAKYQQDCSKEVEPILVEMNKALNDNTIPSLTAKIGNFYAILDKNENLNIIENDKKISKSKCTAVLRFLGGIAAVAVTLLTLIPGWITAGVIYKLTGRTSLDLFKSRGERYKKEFELVRTYNLKYFTKPKAENSSSKMIEENSPVAKTHL